MSEPVASTTPVTPVTTNGAPKGAAQAPSAPPPASAAPETPAELAAARAEAAKWKESFEKKTRENIVTRRKAESERASFGEKLKAADEYAQLQKHANVNPIAVAKKLWGDNWSQRLMEVQANGGAPTADSIAFELEQREAAFDKKLAAHDEALRKAQSEAAAKQTQNEIRQIQSDIAAYGKANAADFPLLMDRVGGDEKKFAGAIFQTIKNTYDSTSKRDPETGELLEHGRTMSYKEAAESIENELYAIAEKAHTFEKYTPKLREKLQPPKPSGTVSPSVKSVAVSSAGAVGQQPQRRTLSNDLTGSTPSDTPKYRTNAERLAAAVAKYDATARRG